MNGYQFRNNIIAVLMTKGVVAVLKLCIGILTARLLGPAAKGIFVATTYLPGIAVTMGSISVGESLVYLIGKKKVRHEDIAGTTLLLITVCSLLVVLFLFFSQHSIEQSIFKDIPKHFFLIVYILVPIMMVNYYGSYVFRGVERFDTYNYLSVFTLVITILTIGTALLFIKKDVETALYAFVLATFINAVIVIYYLYIYSSKIIRFSWREIIPAFKYGGVTHLASVFSQLEYQFDIFLLLYFMSPTEVGIYSVGVTMAQTLWYITNAINTVLFPKIASILNRDDAIRLMNKVMRITLFVILVVSLLLILTGYHLVTILYGNEFSVSYYVFIALLPAIIFDAIYRTLFSWFKGIGKPFVVSIYTGFSLIINLLLNIVLIPKYGLYGAAISSIISYGFRTILVFIVYIRSTKTPFKNAIVIQKSEILDIKIKIQNTLQNLLKNNTK